MYTVDFDTMNDLYKERLRDAEERRAHNQLVRAALAQDDNRNRGGFLNQIKRLVSVRNVKQEVSDVRRATAV